MEYKYSKRAGALNEAAEAPSSSVTRAARNRANYAQSNAPAFPQQQQLAPLDHDDYVSAHNTAVTGIAVAPPSAHAQAVLPPQGQHAGMVFRAPTPPASGGGGLDPIRQTGVSSMFFYTVLDGQRVRVIRPDGTVDVLVGPRRVWRGRKRFEPMPHYVAHPGEFLIVRYRDGRQEHLAGPANLWFDARQHLSVDKEDALPIAAKEAVVAYSNDGAGAVSRRIVHGPATFVPAPGEWLHTFSWHGSRGGDDGYQKVPNALVFQKLWLMPDQMYHDVPDVRTADDAVITVRLMIFFELVAVETMLETTHDPIGDFVNAATSDVVDFTGRHDFDGFKRNTERLNELATYRQLTARAEQCGYRINKIVYRGYGAPESLQRMHDEAIESRTRLQLERATQQQAQDLEDFKLERSTARAARQRAEQAAEVAHEIEQAKARQQAELGNDGARREFSRTEARRDAEQRLALERAHNDQQRAYFDGLRALGVDLTAVLTQGRADQVIEVRGAGAKGTHVHLPGGNGSTG